MKRNPFNPLLFSPAETESPAAGGDPGASPAPGAPEGEDGAEKDKETGKDAGETGAEARVGVFTRAQLHLRGKNFLINQISARDAELAGLRAELRTLKTRNEELAAAADKAQTVSQGVRKELTSLGISESAAPDMASPEAAEKKMSRAEFDALEHSARNKFIAEGGKVVR